MTRTTRSTSAPINPRVRKLVVASARAHFFAHGFRTVTMDELAGELRMSKKTLYALFDSKTALVEAAIEDKLSEMDAELGQILSPRTDDFSQVLGQLLGCLQRQIAEIQPPLARDMRTAPELFARVEAGRRELIARHFGRFFAEGQQAGIVRGDLPAPLIVESLLAIVRGVMNPAKLAQLELTPQRGFSAILGIVLQGVLTDSAKAEA